MTIDEAIKHCEEVAEKLEKKANIYEIKNMYLPDSQKPVDCVSCAADHRQLAEWLRELKEIKNQIDSGELSDGYHTFNQLYHQRAMLFATIVNQNSDKAWKTHKHEDGEPCFGGGWFLVTIDTPQGAYGYHYEDKYWNLFKCKELDKAKHWDGYTEEDVDRLLSLIRDIKDIKASDVQPVKHGYWEEVTDYGGWGDTHYRCSVCGEEWYLEDGKPKDNNMNFCPRCGARMDGDTE